MFFWGRLKKSHFKVQPLHNSCSILFHNICHNNNYDHNISSNSNMIKNILNVSVVMAKMLILLLNLYFLRLKAYESKI